MVQSASTRYFADDRLPAGWYLAYAAVSDSGGRGKPERRYFVNPALGISQWMDPRPPPLHWTRLSAALNESGDCAYRNERTGQILWYALNVA